MNKLILEVNADSMLVLYDIVKIMLIGRYNLKDKNFKDIYNGYIVSIAIDGGEAQDVSIAYNRFDDKVEITISGNSATSVMAVYDDIEEVICENC